MRWTLLALAACGGVTPDLGFGTELQLPGAQFRPGPFPAATGGPPTQSLSTTHPTVTIGRIHEQLTGILDPAARAAIIGIDGVDGAWIVVAGPPNADTPDSATVTATYGLDEASPAGPFTMLFAATDSDGLIGTPSQQPLVAVDAPPPAGDLVVGLTWDSTADLDLHVVDPTGGEAWSQHPNTWQAPPPGEPSDPNAYLTGGWLDHDGNADCHVDGLPSEHVIWTTRTGSSGPIAPIIPPGTYTVRVDTPSLCRDASASWYVDVYSEGVLVGAARGVSTPDDVLDQHNEKGDGITALQFTLP